MTTVVIRLESTTTVLLTIHLIHSKTLGISLTSKPMANRTRSLCEPLFWCPYPSLVLTTSCLNVGQRTIKTSLGWEVRPHVTNFKFYHLLWSTPVSAYPWNWVHGQYLHPRHSHSAKGIRSCDLTGKGTNKLIKVYDKDSHWTNFTTALEQLVEMSYYCCCSVRILHQILDFMASWKRPTPWVVIPTDSQPLNTCQETVFRA